MTVRCLAVVLAAVLGSSTALAQSDLSRNAPDQRPDAPRSPQYEQL
jgi:hypothetical protein